MLTIQLLRTRRCSEKCPRDFAQFNKSNNGSPLTFKLLFLVLLLGTGKIAWAQGSCPANAPVTGNHCYFVAASGLDTNSGTSESSPWLHAPGMPNCSNNCATVQATMNGNITGGQGFIFRGGDTWHEGNSSASPYTGGTWNIGFGWGTDANCIYEGTQTGCIYYGVDTVTPWYNTSVCSSWCRPLITGDNPTSTTAVSSCAYQTGTSNNLVVGGVAVILDNFELTGLCENTTNPTSTTNEYLAYFGSGIAGSGTFFMTNLYMHGWTGTSNIFNVPANTGVGVLIGGGNNGLQTLDHVVIDGSDSAPQIFEWATFPSFYHFRDSIVRYASNGVGQWCHDIHDNIFEYIVPLVGGGHTNILECNYDNGGGAVNQPSGTPNVFYNNIIRHSSSNVDLWFCPTQIPEYWFNNLMYDTQGEGWSYAGPPTYSCSNTGGQFMFNNTLVDGNSGGWTQPCSIGSYVTQGGQYLTVYNEHLINTGFDSVGSSGNSCTGVNSTTNVSMSDATATSQGYMTGNAGTYLSNTCANESTTPCSPTATTSSTVGAGSNLTAYCTTLAGYGSEYAIGTEAANACNYGTTDGCSYNTATHTMNCPAQPAVARSTSWDSGAYQYSGVGATQKTVPPPNNTVQPPTSLKVILNQ